MRLERCSNVIHDLIKYMQLTFWDTFLSRSLAHLSPDVNYAAANENATNLHDLFHLKPQVVQEYERAVIFRLGRLMQGGAKGPGTWLYQNCDVFSRLFSSLTLIDDRLKEKTNEIAHA